MVEDRGTKASVLLIRFRWSPESWMRAVPKTCRQPLEGSGLMPVGHKSRPATNPVVPPSHRRRANGNRNRTYGP